MKTSYIFIIFIVVAGIQLFVPAQMILSQENILKTGTVYKFKTQPVDPNDPFRGKFITLNYEIESYKTKDSLWQRAEAIYVYLENDELGFAKVNKVSRTFLDVDRDYIVAKITWYNKFEQTLNFDLPFNRYYMEETKAYDAEVAYNRVSRDTISNNTHALVYIKNGEAVLSDVIINNMSIRDYVVKEKDSE